MCVCVCVRERRYQEEGQERELVSFRPVHHEWGTHLVTRRTWAQGNKSHHLCRPMLKNHPSDLTRDFTNLLQVNTILPSQGRMLFQYPSKSNSKNFHSENWTQDHRDDTFKARKVCSKIWQSFIQYPPPLLLLSLLYKRQTTRRNKTWRVPCRELYMIMRTIDSVVTSGSQDIVEILATTEVCFFIRFYLWLK